MSVEYLTEKDGEKMREAIKALEQEPCDVFDEYGNYKYPSDVELTEPNTATSMPCEDAISRQAAIDAVAFGITYATGVNMETGEVSHPFAESNQELRKAIHRICELPPVNPQPKTGHWINVNEGKWNTIPAYKCSACGANADLRDWSGESLFCPWCGAKMVEPQERSDRE